MVALAGQTARTKAGLDGKWIARLDLHDSGAGPFRLFVRGRTKSSCPMWSWGRGLARLRTIQHGASFESNSRSRGRNRLLRQPSITPVPRGEVACSRPADDCKGQWILASPETAGDFSAVGYDFGKRLQQTLKLPLGIINASWGGTFSEAWTSIDGINQVESLTRPSKPRRKVLADYPGKKKAFVSGIAAWLHANHAKTGRRPTRNFLPESTFRRRVGPA